MREMRAFFLQAGMLFLLQKLDFHDTILDYYMLYNQYLLRPILVYRPKDLNRDWSPRFSTLRDKNGSI